MRILFATTAGTGHFTPMLPVIQACVAAGHQVRVAAPTSFASHVERVGVDHAPFDDVPDEILGPILASLPSLGREEANARVIGEVFARHDAHHAVPGVRATVEAWRPHLLVRDPCEFGSLAVATATGTPHVEVAIGVGDVQVWAGPLIEQPLEDLAAEVGLEPGALMAELRHAPLATSVPPTVDGPSGSARPVWRFRDSAATATAGSLPVEWGDPSLPLVYVTFGSVAGALGPFAGVYRAALDALADRPVRVLLTTGHALDTGSLGEIPTNALVQQWWPQEEVMPLAAAMVGHGGFGTTMSALAAGLPQVVLPLFSSDQFTNAERVAAVGAGLAVEGGPGAVRQLAQAVDMVLADDRYASAARSIGAEIEALPDVAELVPRLTDHGAKHA